MPPRPKKQTNNKKTVRRRTKKSSILDRIEPINFDDTGIKIVVYGKSGSGKTTFWSTFPGPILALVCSGRKKPGELRSINTPAIKKKTKKLIIESPQDLFEITKEIQNGLNYKTVVLDHITAFQDLTLKEILDLDELPVQKSWGLASREDYQTCTQQVKEALRALLSVDCNVVVVAQEREFKPSEDDGIIAPNVTLNLTPASIIYLEATSDYICQTFKRKKMVKKQFTVRGKKKTKLVPAKGVDYLLRTGPDETFQTKFRMPIEQGKGVPDEILNPTYEKLIKLIEP